MIHLLDINVLIAGIDASLIPGGPAAYFIIPPS